MAIAQKESSESSYWLELLKESKYITNDIFNSISFDSEDIQIMLSSITISSKTNSL